DIRLRLGDALRHHRRNLLIYLYCSAYPVVSGGESPAPRGCYGAGVRGTTVIRRRLFLAGAGSLALPSGARATDTATILVGAKPGSPVDGLARAFVPFLVRHLPGINFTIANLSGDAGLAALQALAQAEPTGATLAWVATPTLPARMVDRAAGDLLQRVTLVG